MIVTYLRSSSIGCLSICEMQYYFTYVLGMKSPSGLKASMGTTFHRVMQVLADKQIAQRNKKKLLEDDDIGNLTFEECDNLELVTERCYNYYKENDNPNLSPKELKQIIKWVHASLAYRDGELDPRNMNVEATELFFDIEIKKDWAKYEYEVNGEKIEGYLSIKGTVDLIINEGGNYFQVLDFKTGKRLDWATGKEKTHADLHKDKQLLLYYYALKNMYPDRSFFISIYFINDGGLFEMVFDEKDYEKAEKMLKERFQYIKSVELPRQISKDQTDWKCKYLCKFSQEWENTGKTTCQFFHDMLKSEGMKKVSEKYIDLKKMTQYQGGGRLAKDD